MSAFTEDNMSVFDNRHKDANGYSYYELPEGYPLFKAGKDSKDTMVLAPNKHYFFGVKNTDTDYIESYENEYGIIFEFKTKQPYRLLALDDKETTKKLYTNAPENIQKILQQNYGYPNGVRNSVGNKDRELSEYLCKIGFNGYATNKMNTDFEGTFHPEFMICDVSNIEYAGRVTSETRAKILFDKANQQVITKPKKSRKKGEDYIPDSINFMSPTENLSPHPSLFDSPPAKTKLFDYSPVKTSLFDSPPVKKSLFASPSPTRRGGKTRRTKTRKNKKSPK